MKKIVFFGGQIEVYISEAKTKFENEYIVRGSMKNKTSIIKDMVCTA